MSNQYPESSQGNNQSRLRNIARVDYTGQDTTGRYDYRERFYSCRGSQSTQGLWSLSTSSSSSRSTSPTPVVPLSVELAAAILTPLHVFDSPRDNRNITMEEVDNNEIKLEDIDTSAEDEQWEILEDELSDFLEENNQLSLNAEDINSYIERLEEFRRGYKTVERSLKKKVSSTAFASRYLIPVDNVLDKIKRCIKHAKESKIQLREHEQKIISGDRSLKERQLREERLQLREATDFLMTEASRLIKELEIEFKKTGDADDEELMRRREDYPENSLQLERLSHKVQEIYKTAPDDYNKTTINNMKIKYDQLLENKGLYDTELQKRMKERELLKEKAFQTSALDIKLPEFSGYECKIDIYSFQLEFEKMYNSSTPKHRQADLLKNNYLKDPAYSLVRSLNEIDAIWERLKKAYGDKKVLLNNKLSAVTKNASSLKAKDPEQLKGGLIMVINAMNDLIELAVKHNIEKTLYYGPGLNIIYKVLGEGRLHRWLTSIVDEDLEERALWDRLIKFLERDLKVAQEKALVTQSFQPTIDSNQNQERREGSQRNNRERRDENRSSYQVIPENEDIEQQCHFCGELGHVATRGPRGIPLIQYYACEQFVTLPPQERFRKLREKGLCHQCLYPGAKYEVKHVEGTCQKTFACKDPAHNAHPCKKHVLVCAEHAEKEENVAMFNDYKQRFITRQRAPLAEYSKNIRLSFFVGTTSVLQLPIQIHMIHMQ